MIRTQVSMSEEEYRAAKRRQSDSVSRSQSCCGSSLRNVLPADESAPWMRYAGMIESGDPHSSQRIDEIVYGQKP